MSVAVAGYGLLDHGLAACDLTAMGVSVRVVVTDAAALATARQILVEELDRVDRACSRFRPDSELTALNQAGGRRVRISALLAEAITVGLDAARASGGDVDPTLGMSLVRLGYDRDFAQLPPDGVAVAVSTWRGSRWTQVQLDRQAGTARLPVGVQVDLGATAKAWCADRAAAQIHDRLGCGVLVSLGGDISVAGQPPQDGWAIRVQDCPGPVRQPARARSAVVSIRGGGLATSSTAARRWRRGGQSMHHLLDPATGLPAVSVWRTASVTAPTCLAANVASSSAIVRSQQAVAQLRVEGLPARMVSHAGEVSVVNGWPQEATDDRR